MDRAVVMAHYDSDGIVDPYCIAALHEYRKIARHLIVVSTSAPALPPAARELVDFFVCRENVGYDFGSWRAGVETLADPAAFDEIIFVNDSVYGPLFDLGPVFDDPRIATADFWGMCLSEQGTKRRGRRTCPHLQSWFFAMRRPLLQSEAFSAFWGAVEPLADKDDIIDRYELGMSEHFLDAGFRMAALYDARLHGAGTWADIRPHLSLAAPRRSWRHARKARREPHNPSELFPFRLLAAGVPFVKVGLLRTNHYGLDLRHVLDGIRRATPYDVGLIEAHLRRVDRPAGVCYPDGPRTASRPSPSGDSP